MAASELEVAVFIDTDFGTHLAVAVPPHIAAGALKREVERVHFKCFPNIGEIKVDGFMVKQNSNFYHLPDTLLTKLTSRVESVQFLHVKAQPLNEFIEPRLPENADCFPNLNNGAYPSERQGYCRHSCTSKIRIDDKKRTRKILRSVSTKSIILACNTKRKRKRTQRLEHVEKNSDLEELIKDAEKFDGSIDTSSYHNMPNDEVRTTKQRYASSSTNSELSSEVMSVSSIIKRYFPSHDEVSSVPNRSSGGITRSEPEERSPSLLPSKSPFKAGTQKRERSSKLGKRLVMASYNLGISPNRGWPEISLCNSRGKKFQELMSLAKSSCFEISDRED
ncbi:hypothetical protein SDJN03_01086, partial [Cucurbita argyrosperma subsp. sororia]